MKNLRFKTPDLLIRKRGFPLIVLVGLTLFTSLGSPVFSQIRGGDAEEFFEDGDQEMEQNIQNLENEEPTSESTEEQEEQELVHPSLRLEERDPNTLETEEVPSPPLGDGDNVPTPPPEGEVQIQIP